MGKPKTLHALPDGEAHVVRVERRDDGFSVRCDGPELEALVSGGSDAGVWSVLTQNGSFETRVTRDNGTVHVDVAGERFSFALDADAAGGDGAKRGSARADVKAPMPGKIVKLLVQSGDAVAAGQGVVLFEAMKMQNEIKSPQDGVVSEIAVEEGQAVEARDRLFVIQNKD